MKTKYHAKLVINNIDKMSKVNYKRLVRWLEKASKDLKVRQKGVYDKVYTKRLMK